MTDYIKIPTFPTQDSLRGIEAISPYPRINPQQPHAEDYPHHPADTAKKKDKHAPRRFAALRRVIDELQGSAQISKVNFATAETELHRMGLTIIEEKLIRQLLQLRIPLESIEQLQLQINQNHDRGNLGSDRKINSTKPTLFPVSTQGLSEYNLMVDELNICSGPHTSKIIDQINQEGFCIDQQARLRLTFSRVGPAPGTANELLKLTISVLLGVMESDEAYRRAILYPRGDKSYGLYADKLISLSI